MIIDTLRVDDKVYVSLPDLVMFIELEADGWDRQLPSDSFVRGQVDGRRTIAKQIRGRREPT